MAPFDWVVETGGRNYYRSVACRCFTVVLSRWWFSVSVMLIKWLEILLFCDEVSFVFTRVYFFLGIRAE